MTMTIAITITITTAVFIIIIIIIIIIIALCIRRVAVLWRAAADEAFEGLICLSLMTI